MKTRGSSGTSFNLRYTAAMSQPDHRFLSFFLREPVYIVDEPDPVPADPLPLLPHQGEGRQQVLVLVREAEHAFLAPEDQAFLNKVLSAVSLSADDILLVNWEEASFHLQQGIALDSLLPGLPYRVCLVLGEVPAPWSLSNFFQLYEVNNQHEKMLLQAETLGTLIHDVDKKVRFWKGLQQLFGLT